MQVVLNPWYMSSQVVEEQSRALQLDALRSSHPVEVPIRHAKADAFWIRPWEMWIEMQWKIMETT